MIKLTYVFLILISFSAVGNEIVSLDKLYEERDFYDGKELLVSGRFHLQLESNCLCGEKHYIWLNENSIIENNSHRTETYNLQYVGVTGSSGFIGTHLVSSLIKKGYRVRGLDIHSIELEKRLDGFEFHYCDVRDRSALLKSTKGLDATIHLAGLLGTDTLVSMPREAIATNLVGTLNILDASKIHGFRLINAALDCDWDNSYMISKNAAEAFVRMYMSEFGIDACSIKMSHVFGPGQKDKPVRKVVPSFINAALSDHNLEIYGSQEKSIDLVFVSDVISGAITLLERSKLEPTYVARSGTEINLCDLAKLIIHLCKSESSIQTIGSRIGEPKYLGAPRIPHQATNLVTSVTSIDDALRETINWNKSNV